jgi:F-type H+-transporting ATPase subunit b
MNITFTLIAQSLVFAIFIWFTARFVWPPLMRAVDDRQKKIADGLAAAEKGNRSLAEASAKTDEQLKAAKAQAQEILAAANKQAGQLVEQAKGSAQTEAERIKAAAREDVDREITRARETLRKQVGELAVAGAAQILKREINAQTHADVLKELSAKI